MKIRKMRSSVDIKWSGGTTSGRGGRKWSGGTWFTPVCYGAVSPTLRTKKKRNLNDSPADKTWTKDEKVVFSTSKQSQNKFDSTTHKYTNNTTLQNTHGCFVCIRKAHLRRCDPAIFLYRKPVAQHMMNHEVDIYRNMPKKMNSNRQFSHYTRLIIS